MDLADFDYRLPEELIAQEPPADRAGVAAAMRRAGIFVHPSPFETFGMVAAEALASGLPVAARRSGGVEEILAGQTGGAELADGDDPEALADAILRLRSRLAEIDPAAIRATVTGRFPTAATIEAILGQARDAAAELSGLLTNHLEPAVFRVCPTLAPLRDELISLGLTSIRVSGSGSAFYCLYDDQEPALRAAKNIQERLSQVATVVAAAPVGESPVFSEE